jgi:uncharacterized membrane protein
VCAAAGLSYFGIGLSSNDVWAGVAGLAIMVAYGGILLALRRRSEPMALLSGNPADERQAQVVVRASAATLQVVAVVPVVAMMVALALDSTYATVLCGICALLGATFMASVVWFSRRG